VLAATYALRNSFRNTSLEYCAGSAGMLLQDYNGKNEIISVVVMYRSHVAIIVHF
jgi:hypothetical protein